MCCVCTSIDTSVEIYIYILIQAPTTAPTPAPTAAPTPAPTTSPLDLERAGPELILTFSPGAKVGRHLQFLLKRWRKVLPKLGRLSTGACVRLSVVIDI